MIKALIIDDEAAAANVLQLMLERHIPEITSMRIATKIPDAVDLIRNFKPDIVFQDIVMPEKNGFEFLRELDKIDYLLKPINAEELRGAVDRFLEKRNQRRHTDSLLKNLLTNLGQKNETGFRLAVPTVNGALFFSPADIIRLEGDGNYTQFHLAGGKKYLSSKTMKEYEEILLMNGFVRIHKSHLVNKDFIENYLNEGAVVLSDKTALPISRQRKQGVMAQLLKK